MRDGNGMRALRECEREEFVEMKRGERRKAKEGMISVDRGEMERGSVKDTFM